MVEMKFEFGSRSGVMLSKTYFDKSLGHRLPILRVSSPIPTICDIVDSLMARYPEFYYKESGGNFYKVEQIEASQLCLIRDMLEEVRDNHWIDYASGPALDHMGKLLGITRREDEDDETLKLRIKATIPTLAGGGTISMLQQVLAPILDVDEDDIVVGDGYLAGDTLGDNIFLLMMDGNANDWEGNHDGGVHAGSWVSGRWVQAYRAVFGSYIDMPTHADFNTGSFLVYARVKLTGNGGDGVIMQRVERSTPTIEWCFDLEYPDGNLNGYIKLSTGYISLSMPSLMKKNKWYFVAMGFDSTTKKLSIWQVEDGTDVTIRQLTVEESAAASYNRYYSGGCIEIAGSMNNGSYLLADIDHVGYRSHAPTHLEMAKLAYCAPGLNHYGHFTITVKGDVSGISLAQWEFVETIVNKYKAAGTVFDGFGNKLIHNISVDADGMYWHYTDCSLTDSLNRVKL